MMMLLLVAASCGCRYSTGGGLPPEIQTIGVTMLRNETRVPGLEGEVTRAAISALQSGGRLKVVYSEGDPDLVLVGRVESYTRKSGRTDRYGDMVAYTVVIGVRLSVRKNDGDYLFKNLRLTNRSTDPESGAVDLGKGQRESHGRAEAVETLGRNIARSIVEQGW
jgi:Lipopolysaccharide-assembly